MNRAVRITNRITSVYGEDCRYTDEFGNERYGRLTSDRVSWWITFGSERDRLWVVLPYTLSGDYCGSTVEKSNRLAFVESYPDYVVECHGGFYSRCAVVDIVDVLAAFNPSHPLHGILDDVKGLQDYPLLCEDTLSRVESEGTEEALNLYGLDEIEEELWTIILGVPQRRIRVLERDWLRTTFYDVVGKHGCGDESYCEGYSDDMTTRCDVVARLIVDHVPLAEIVQAVDDWDELAVVANEAREKRLGTTDA